MMTAPGGIRSVEDLRGRRVLVLGLARSGVAASRFLADAGADVTAYDRRPADQLADAIRALDGRPVRLALGIPDPEARALVAAADLIVTSPSVSARFPTTDAWLRDALSAAIDRRAEVLGEVDLFLRLTTARVLAVTGTKGKTTTSSLVAAMLARAGIHHVLGGNIGTPLIERATSLEATDWAVLELSELQLADLTRGADISVYTNVGEDHLDRHGSVEAYRAVKARLAELAPPGGRIILNRDDPGCRELAERIPTAGIVWYALDAADDLGAGLAADGWLLLGGERLIAAADVPIPGRHLLSDVLAAALGASLAGAPRADIGAAVRDFVGVPHRLELVAERDGVRWLNDSQATIPLAATAALRAFGDSPILLIAGGKDKGLDYVAFVDLVAERARAVVLLGETADQLELLLAGRVPVRRASSMPAAVAMAAELAVPGDVVLLAPAAASFDMFVDYAARGEAFRAAVRALGGVS